MPILDTSFLIAVWNADHPDHEAARRRLERQTRKKQPVLRVNAGAIAEASRILRRFAKDQGLDGNAAAREFLTTFLRLPGCSIEARFPDEAWLRYLDHHRLSYVDAWVIEQTRRLQDTPWSYDARLAKAAR